MIKISEDSKIKKYVNAIILAGSVYFLAAAPSIIGKMSENYQTLENKIECTYTK